MKRLPLAIAVIVAWFVIAWIEPFGSSVKCVNGNCQTQAKSSLLAIGLGLAVFGAVWVAPKTAVRATAQAATMGRKVMAFLADGTVFAMCFGPIIAMPLLWLEAAHTGHFAWEFARPSAGPADWIGIFGALALLVVGILAWRRWLNSSNKASIGQFLAGYTVVDGKSLRFEYS